MMREIFWAFMIPVIVYGAGTMLKNILDSQNMIQYHQEMVLNHVGE